MAARTTRKNDEVERNKANLNSCEREPNENEVKIPVNKISEYISALPHNHPIGEAIFEAKLSTIRTGCNNIIISKNDFSVIEHYYYAKQRTYELLGKANEYEANGDIDLAIEVYQEVITIGYDGNEYSPETPYHRLVVLYRKKKDIDGEIRAIEKAITLLTTFNPYGAIFYTQRLEKIFAKKK